MSGSVIGVDTNVLVRILRNDDPKQAEAALAFFEARTAKEPAFIPRETILELVWVLESRFREPRARVVSGVRALTGLGNVIVESVDAIHLALDRYGEGGPGFADQLIIASAQAAGCTHTVTFDRKAARMAGVELLE